MSEREEEEVGRPATHTDTHTREREKESERERRLLLVHAAKRNRRGRMSICVIE